MVMSMKMYDYYIGTALVTRDYMANYLVSMLGGSPENVIRQYEDATTQYCLQTGYNLYYNASLNISIRKYY